MIYPDNWRPVTTRAQQLMQRLQVFKAKRPVRFTLLLSHVTHGLEYFSPGKDEDLARCFATSAFRYVPAEQMAESVDQAGVTNRISASFRPWYHWNAVPDCHHPLETPKAWRSRHSRNQLDRRHQAL
jgi:hypothetical protein